MILSRLIGAQINQGKLFCNWSNYLWPLPLFQSLNFFSETRVTSLHHFAKKQGLFLFLSTSTMNLIGCYKYVQARTRALLIWSRRLRQVKVRLTPKLPKIFQSAPVNWKTFICVQKSRCISIVVLGAGKVFVLIFSKKPFN